MVIVVECPHCGGVVLVEKLNCKIFRHGSFKKNGQQLHPHASKELCESYFEKGLIYGCGKPFKLVESDTKSGEYRAEHCDYL